MAESDDYTRGAEAMRAAALAMLAAMPKKVQTHTDWSQGYNAAITHAESGIRSIADDGLAKEHRD